MPDPTRGRLSRPGRPSPHQPIPRPPSRQCSGSPRWRRTGPGGLRPVEGGIGPMDERQRVVGAGPSATAEPIETPTRTERSCTWIGRATAVLIRSPTSSTLRCGDTAGQQHGELVTAEPGHQVGGSGGFLEPPRDLHQHPVAGQMAEVVVDLLEPVQVDQQQRHGLVRAAQLRRADSAAAPAGSPGSPPRSTGRCRPTRSGWRPRSSRIGRPPWPAPAAATALAGPAAMTAGIGAVSARAAMAICRRQSTKYSR